MATECVRRGPASAASRVRYNRRAYELGGLTFAISHRAGTPEDAPPVHIVGVRQELGRTSARWWTRQENIRTLARSPFVVDLVEAAPVPAYRRIAFEATEMRASDLRVAAIARHFRVDHHTVDKALWFTGP